MSGFPAQQPIEVWGGLECTVVRIGETYRNQIDDTGHSVRPTDLDRIKGLGITTLRYPVLWETIAPDDAEQCDWAWHDARLSRLRQLGLRPIAGLMHHGSGPRYTSLVDPLFPELFSRHAERVASRYPWIDLYTPVNEPLTTARFSALYGHWYPHLADTQSFLRAVVLQCKATALAMRAVRRINPDARLVQTEDIGKTFSTPALVAQADYENQRRWLSLDLLCGRVDRTHPWHDLLLDHGILEADLALLLQGDAAPDIIGVNHYVTSERYLDENLGAYPPCTHGSNGRVSYADVEAVRVDLSSDLIGPEARLREVWDRFGRPMAVTEVHLGCSRDEQLRWLAHLWNAAQAVKADGADVRAVTIWSLFGAEDWDSLLVKRRNCYEPGAFDIRAPKPRPTALARAAASLGASGSFHNPVLGGRGWWQRDSRLYRHSGQTPRSSGVVPGRPLLILAASEALEQSLAAICMERGLPTVLPGMALRSPSAISDLVNTHQPWAVLCLTASGGVDGENTLGPTRLKASVETAVGVCAKIQLPFLLFSSAAVFDGRLDRAYVEADPASSSASFEAELEAVVGSAPLALIVRSGPLFGLAGPVPAGGRRNPNPDQSWWLAGLQSPTYAPHLFRAALDLLIDGERGIWHLANVGAVSWRDFQAKLTGSVAAQPALDMHDRLARQRVLQSEKAWIMPGLEDAIAQFRRDRPHRGPRTVLEAAE